MNASVSYSDRHTWALFGDWCTALGYSSLPATPHTLARFLDSHPAAPATQRRRVSVVDAAHHRTGLPQPGRGETVRAAIDADRAQRLRALSTTVGSIVAQLPVSGWPTALFARRDALVLVLASTGMSYRRIAALNVGEVMAHDDRSAICVHDASGVKACTSDSLASSGVFAAHILRRWLEVLGHQHRYPSIRLLEETMAAGDGTELGGYDQYLHDCGGVPLLPPIDRWGYTPLKPAALTPHAISAIVRAHLDGQPAAHSPRIRRLQPVDVDVDVKPTDGDQISEVLLDPGYYEHGIAARRKTHTALHDVDSILDDVEEHANRLLAELLALVEASEGSEP